VKNTILCLFFLLLVGCNAQKDETDLKNRSVPVTAGHPIVRDVSFYVEAIGTLHPKACAEIFSQTDAYITEIHVLEGQYVRRGDPLFSLDQSICSVRLREVQAQLDMERATFQGLQKKMSRYESLAQKDLIAKSEWDELETQLEKARSCVDLYTASLHKAKIELEQCTLRSPFDGRVGKISHSLGGFAKSMTAPLTNISQIDSLQFECSITEKEFFEIPKGVRNVEITPLSSPGTTRPGTITFFDNSFETSRGMLLVKGLVENTEENSCLLPGQIVRVRIPTRTDTSVILIPQKAIRHNQEGPYVYVVTSEMTTVVRQIVLGEEYGTDRIAQKGLELTDTIIIDGHLRLSEGCKVSV
jgi:membrane fusion protein, multidrug efflux system